MNEDSQTIDSVLGSLGVVIGNDNLGTILLIITIINLGLLSVCVRYSMAYTDIGPLSFVAIRFLVSLLYLIILEIVSKLCSYYSKPSHSAIGSATSSTMIDLWNANKDYWINLSFWGGSIGVILLGMTLGIQYGEITESAGKTSFVIGMYVVVVPLAEMALSGFSYFLPWRSYAAAALVVPGIFILSGCAEENCFSFANFQVGVMFNVIAMFCIAGHALMTARGMALFGSTPIIMYSFSVCAVLSTIVALIFEPEFWIYPFVAFRTNWWLIVLTSLGEFLAIISVTFALGIISTSRAAIVMSVESLSGAVFGYLILGETFRGIEYLGGALLLAAVLLEVWPCDAEKEHEDVIFDSVLGADENTSLIDRGREV